jgi:bifunctional non-homologous end joining protein LigD
MIHRMDPPLDSGYEPLPASIAPMLAKVGVLPRDDAEYGYEIKWDGIRAITYVEGGRIRIESRNRLDITSQYPELRKLGEALGANRVVLDGEIVALDEKNRPNFGLLQGRMHLASESMVRKRMVTVPITYMIFDLLFDGHSLMDIPYEERRAKLKKLALAGPSWQTPAYHAGAGKAMLAASKEQGLEGIIAKKLDSKYEPGKRNNCWIKIKNQLRQEFIICGWLPGEGNREGQIGSLLLGYYDKSPDEARQRGAPQRLIYAGNVGTGFTDAFLTSLGKTLQPLRRKTNPFDVSKGIRKNAVFVEPSLVGEIEYTEMTHGNIVRHPSFKGLREDKPAEEVTLELP